ncbi:MAG: hypothetical protein AB1430_07635 [Pseudomonadota bacterium]
MPNNQAAHTKLKSELACVLAAQESGRRRLAYFAAASHVSTVCLFVEGSDHVRYVAAPRELFDAVLADWHECEATNNRWTWGCAELLPDGELRLQTHGRPLVLGEAGVGDQHRDQWLAQQFGSASIAYPQPDW